LSDLKGQFMRWTNSIFRLFGSLCLKPVFFSRVSHILQGKDKKMASVKYKNILKKRSMSVTFLPELRYILLSFITRYFRLTVFRVKIIIHGSFFVIFKGTLLNRK
jgi:hypothetical protein